jgi:hypothetical protein
VSDVFKAVPLSAEERDRLNSLTIAFEEAESDLRTFESKLRIKYSPEQRAYAPFYDFPMEIVRERNADGNEMQAGEIVLIFGRKLR